MDQPSIKRLFVVFLLGLLGVSACTIDSAKNHYVLAEKLWNDGKYVAAVVEFQKTTLKDPHGKLGLQALFRSAMTESLFLSQYEDAVRKFKNYTEATNDPATTWEAQLQIGEILFSKLERYDQAISHYQTLVQQRPDAPEVPSFLFRIGKSQFFLWQFDEALETYRKIIKKFPKSDWAEKAMFEIGVTHFTRGEQHPSDQAPGSEAYQEAMDSYQRFLKKYPKSTMAPLAQFGIASCLEELDQLDAAYHAYEELKATYPSPNVIEIKLARIRERKAQRSR